MPECPSLEFGNLERAKPYGAMGESQGFPQIPADMVLLTDEQQASVLVQVFMQAAESYSTCELHRKVLIEWIDDPSIPKDE
jgi:hypothetical protein